MKLFRQSTERDAALHILADFRRANIRGTLSLTPEEANAVLELAECAVETPDDYKFVPRTETTIELGRRLIAVHSGFRERQTTRLEWARIFGGGGFLALCAACWWLVSRRFRK